MNTNKKTVKELKVGDQFRFCGTSTLFELAAIEIRPFVKKIGKRSNGAMVKTTSGDIFYPYLNESVYCQ